MNYEYCLRCGRKLKSEKAKQLGYGPHCYKKMIISRMGKKSLIRWKIDGNPKNDGKTKSIS